MPLTAHDILIDAGLATIADPAGRARQAAALITDLQAAIEELGRVRRVAILEMVSAGMSYRQIGQRLDIAAPRVGQIVNAKPVVRTVVRTVTVTDAEGEATAESPANPDPEAERMARLEREDAQ